MRSTFTLVSVLSGILTLMFSASGHAGDCDPALFKDVSDTTTLGIKRVAVASLINKNNFDEAQKHGTVTAIFPNFAADGKYDEFEKKVETLKSSYNLQDDTIDWRNFVSSRFSIEGRTAYYACVNQQKNKAVQLHITAINNTFIQFSVEAIGIPSTMFKVKSLTVLPDRNSQAFPYRSRLIYRVAAQNHSRCLEYPLMIMQLSSTWMPQWAATPYKLQGHTR